MIIKVIGNEKRFIDKCIKYKLNLKNICRYIDYILVTIDSDQYDEILRLCYFSKIEIVEYLGLKKYLKIFRKHWIDFLLMLLFFILTFLISNIIVRIDINHENKELKNYIKDILKDYNVDIYKFRLSNSKLNKLSDEILLNNRDKLDFISIERIGMKYVVNIEERILPNIRKIDGFCHIVALKDGVISSINASRGIEMVEPGNFVHKGDILITGEIKLNDEVKSNVCASGEVIGNIWYKVKVSIPKIKVYKEYTDKYRYKVKYKDKYFYNKNYNLYDEYDKFSLFSFKIVKQREYILKEKVLSHDELINEALRISKESILNKIGKNNTIIEEKVLKEYKNNSTIDVEIFINVLENIGISSEFKVGE